MNTAITILGYHLETPLDPLRGSGYQFTSGVGLGTFGFLVHLHHVRCEAVKGNGRRCWRKGHLRASGHVRCGRHKEGHVAAW